MRLLAHILILASLLLGLPLAAQGDRVYPEEQVVSFGSKSYDFGDILLSDGPVNCTFTFTNKAAFKIQIFNIVSSCGCTKPTWTKGYVAPGEKGVIDVVFNNNQGPFPFDKTLTVYMSNLASPILLHVRGVSHEKMKPLSERFPLHVGNIGFRNMESTIGYVEQGRSKADRITIANFGRKSATVKAVPLTGGLSVKIVPEQIPGGETAILEYCVNTKSTGEQKWGKEQFLCQFEVNGKLYPDTFKVNIFIRDDFSAMDEASRSRAGCASAERSYFEFGEVSYGKSVTATFTIKNVGHTEMAVRKIDCDNPKTKILTSCPFTLAPGASATIKASVDTRREKGEALDILSVLTNSPSKPILNLYISGSIK